MFAPVKPENTDTRNDVVDNNFIRNEPLFHLPVIATLFLSFVFVCTATVDLRHHVRDLTLVGIPIFAACTAMKAVIGSLVAESFHRKCVAVSRGMQDMSLCTRQLETSSARACDKNIQIFRCTCQRHLTTSAAHLLACAASSTALRRVNPSERTLLSALEHLTTTARMNLRSALFVLVKPAVAVMLTMSLLLFPVISAQTCANPTLGQARAQLAAASLPSGLVFFAGGWTGKGTSVCVCQLRRVFLCGRDLTTTVLLRCCVPLMLLYTVCVCEGLR